MGSIANHSPIIVVLGQTASGKTALAISLAKLFDGEIIAADSRTVYEGMDIGTAKPTLSERQGIRHHLIDIVKPDERFTVVDFQRLAAQAIGEISSRHKLPIIVGGTGLYIDSILYGFDFRGAPDDNLRSGLKDATVEELQRILLESGISIPNNSNNPRHLIRAIETRGAPATRTKLRPNTLVIGMQLDSVVLKERIADRINVMIQNGLAKEVQSLGEKYGWETAALQAPAYKAFHPYVEGEATLDRAKQQFIQYDTQYAKRQKTWFKRNTDIIWISKEAQAVDLVTTFLSK